MDPIWDPIFCIKFFLSSPHLKTLHLACHYQKHYSAQNPPRRNTSATWSYIPQLEESIIDNNFYYPPSVNSYFRLEWLYFFRSPQKLRRLVLVYITDTL